MFFTFGQINISILKDLRHFRIIYISNRGYEFLYFFYLRFYQLCYLLSFFFLLLYIYNLVLFSKMSFVLTNYFLTKDLLFLHSSFFLTLFWGSRIFIFFIKLHLNILSSNFILINNPLNLLNHIQNSFISHFQIPLILL